MKRNLLISLTLAAFFIIMSSLSDASLPAFLSPEPNLPEIPYGYDVDFPEHVLVGSWTSVDPTSFNQQITSDGATLGRVLFYDEQLSAKNNVSCGSCHAQEFAFADNAQFSEGIDAQLTERNSPNLNDLAWSNGGLAGGGPALFWDCRETDLEKMVLQPIEHEGELGKDLDYMVEKLSRISYYPDLFKNAFGSSEITSGRVGSAISQFIRSMSSFDSKYDQVKMGQAAFTTSERRGEEIFETNCGTVCHGEPGFSSSRPLNNGLDSVFTDEGMGGWNGNPSSIGKFKSPSLRNIEFTAPYMHDGRFETLEEVIDFYSEEIKEHPNKDFWWVGQRDLGFKGFDFTDQEKEDLLNFMKALTSTNFLTHDKWSDPFKSVNSSNNIELANAINVFPNPVENQLSIDLGSLTAERTNLSLYDLRGKLVWKNQMSNTTAKFNIDNTSTGIYILELDLDGEKATKKLFFR